jgi:hypothetical protein
LNRERAATWIVDTQKHLQEFTGDYLSFYDATILAGQCARIMARIRGMEVIDNFRTFSAMATPIGVLPTQLKMSILPTLEKNGTITVKKDAAGNIQKIEEHIPPESEILKITHDIWEKSDANEVERASILNLDQCSIIPRTEKELLKSLEEGGHRARDSEMALELQTEFKILKKSNLTGSSPLFYSPYVWGENAAKIVGFVSHLDGPSKKLIENLLSTISLDQAVPLEKIVNIPSELFSAIRKTGLVDVCHISTKIGVEKCFAFTPRMWGTLRSNILIPDIYDDVKLFLSSISFGKEYSKISKIWSPVELVDALIRRGEVGPATAIGSDYVLLEKHGIVKVKEDTNHIGRYNMYLVKEDVAKTALEVLKHKRVVDLGARVKLQPEPLFQTGEFVNPEQDKIRQGKLTASSAKAEDHLIRVLREEDLQ